MAKGPIYGKLSCLHLKILINMKKLFQISLILSCLLFVGVAILAMSGNGSEAGIPLSLAFFLLSLGIRLHPFLRLL